jgi:hypothetical protein
MGESVARRFFPKEMGKVESQKKSAVSRPLTMKEINTLLSMRFNNEPIFQSIEHFYSEEFKKALQSKTGNDESEKIEKYRRATETEANLLYSDIHAREDKLELGSNGQSN